MAFQYLHVPLSGTGMFVSDLHWDREAAADQRILNVLDKLVDSQDLPAWIVWGGDTFDFMAGGIHTAVEFAEPLLQRMRQLAERGVQQFMLEGNHDFHLQHLEQEVPGLQVVPDGLRSLDGNLLIVHGDYQTAGGLYGPMRHVFRSRFTYWLSHILPAKATYLGARTWSRASYHTHDPDPDQRYKSFVQERLLAEVQGLSAETLICGHIHQPWYFNSGENDTEGHIFVNGGWYEHNSILVLADRASAASGTVALGGTAFTNPLSAQSAYLVFHARCTQDGEILQAEPNG